MPKHQPIELDSKVQAQLACLPMLQRFDIKTLFECKDNIEFKAITGTTFTRLMKILDTKLCRYYGLKITTHPKYCSDIRIMQQSLHSILYDCYRITHREIIYSKFVTIIDLQAVTYVFENQDYTIRNTLKLDRPYMHRRPRNHLHYKPIHKFSDKALFKL